MAMDCSCGMLYGLWVVWPWTAAVVCPTLRLLCMSTTASGTVGGVLEWGSIGCVAYSESGVLEWGSTGCVAYTTSSHTVKLQLSLFSLVLF